MADPYASIDDVDQLRPLDSGERDLAGALLPYAAAIMRRDIASLDANIAAGRVDPLLARYVNIQMIIRVLLNVSGVRQETVGPSSITYDLTQAVGKLVLTDDDTKLLTPPALGLGIGTVALGHARPVRAPDTERPMHRGWGGGYGYGPW